MCVCLNDFMRATSIIKLDLSLKYYYGIGNPRKFDLQFKICRVWEKYVLLLQECICLCFILICLIYVLYIGVAGHKC